MKWKTTVDITKVPCPENLFSRKLQIYKGTMTHSVNIRHLCFRCRYLL